jgi:inorganic phosphate transporter, PiT family
MNFLGVTLGGITVAMGIIHLLPLDIIAEQGSTFGICVVIALLLTAIFWNAGTWYLGLPASSSHTLIGSIFGVGIAISLLPIPTQNPVSLNWHKVIEVIESLLISPVIGFGVAFLVMTLAYRYISKGDTLFEKPKRKDAPEIWLRTTLIGASAWVSFAHGSNDGQKGVGLVMLILISLVPASFAVNPKVDIDHLRADIIYIEAALQESIVTLDQSMLQRDFQTAQKNVLALKILLENKNTLANDIRSGVLIVQKDIKNLTSEIVLVPQAEPSPLKARIESTDFQTHAKHLYSTIDYAPWWVIAMISISLWIGTMFGRKRIVKTLGKKIGNHKMNYAESTSSALITAMTITIASRFGLPVSTTHIFSSSIAGCMMTGKKPWVQAETVRHILLAWVLTLPTTMLVAGLMFSGLWYVFA